MHSLPHAVATMLDPATCGPAFLALPQDVQAEAYDYPARFFEPTVHEIPRPRPDARQLDRAVEALAAATAPLIIAGGGVHYSFAEDELRAFAERHNIPVVETVAGKASPRRLPSAQRRAGRRHRLHVGQRAGRRGRRRARRRHPPAGLHDRLVDDLPQRGGALRRAQHRRLRRRQAPRPAARRRRPGGTRRAVGPARRLARLRTAGRNGRRPRPPSTTATSTRSPARRRRRGTSDRRTPR